jgi:tRNA (Thr-GGU) A37 N-methylase
MTHPILPLEDGIVRMKPIGQVVSTVKQEQTGGFANVRAEVEIEPSLAPLLEGIDEFSHVWILYWMAEVKEHSVARRAQGRGDVPITGMLANR